MGNKLLLIQYTFFGVSPVDGDRFHRGLYKDTGSERMMEKAAFVMP